MSKTYRAFNNPEDILAFNEEAKLAMGLPKAGTTDWVLPGTPYTDEETGEVDDGLTVGIARHDRPHHLTADLVRADMLAEDELAELASAYPAWAEGIAYAIGDLVRYEGTVFACVQAHTSQSDWSPPVVPALWRHTVAAGVIPEWVQPTGAHDAYNKGDLVTFEGRVYKSLIDANVWSPAVYPAGWELQP
jgi:hypothetical protein